MLIKVRRAWTAVKIGTVGISVILLILPLFSVYPIYIGMKILAFVLLFPVSVIILGFHAVALIKKQINNLTIKTALKWLAWLLQAGLIIMCLCAAYFNMVLSPYKTIYSCPYDSRKLVVFESKWIDPTYTAYPVRFIFFYQEQNNGSVTTHDASGFVQVYWDSIEQARVHIKPQTYYGEFSNPNGEIIVTH